MKRSIRFVLFVSGVMGLVAFFTVTHVDRPDGRNSQNSKTEIGLWGSPWFENTYWANQIEAGGGSKLIVESWSWPVMGVSAVCFVVFFRLGKGPLNFPNRE